MESISTINGSSIFHKKEGSLLPILDIIIYFWCQAFDQELGSSSGDYKKRVHYILDRFVIMVRKNYLPYAYINNYNSSYSYHSYDVS